MDFQGLQGPYMDLGSNSGLCLRAEAPPDLGRLLESGPALRTVWTVAVWTPDPGETHQTKLGEAGTGFSHPKIHGKDGATCVLLDRAGLGLLDGLRPQGTQG